MSKCYKNFCERFHIDRAILTCLDLGSKLIKIEIKKIV